MVASQRTFARMESADVTLDYVAKKAEARANKPFHSPRADLPEVLRADSLDYDKYREIRFRRDRPCGRRTSCHSQWNFSSRLSLPRAGAGE